MTDSFRARTTLAVGGSRTIRSSAWMPSAADVDTLPYSLKILLENLLRFEDGANITARRHRGAARTGIRKAEPDREIAFSRRA